MASKASVLEPSPIPWDPVTGIMDNRSHPAEMPDKSFRLLQNVYFPNENSSRRRPGYSKLSTAAVFHNDDLHDQMLALQNFYQGTTGESLVDSTVTTYPNVSCVGPIATRAIGRQPVTMLFGAKSSNGTRRLMAGTESRIYVGDEASGTWKIIADGMGQGVQDGTCPGRRFKPTQNQDVVIFTNDYDEPVYWLFDQPTFGCLMQAVAKIPDMEVIGLTRAAQCWTWRGVTFFADIELDRVRYPHGIVWSDKDNPLSWDPSKPETIAGAKLLNSGEKILGHAEMNNVMLVFTDQRIWQISVVGGSESFHFDERYTPGEHGKGCLVYPNTLVSTGSEVFYGGIDGIYRYDLYSPEPTRPEWIHRGTKVIFSDINARLCENHIAGFWPKNPDTREIYFSWVPADGADGFPEQTLAIDLLRERTSVIDYGMTAMIYYETDNGDSLRQWLIDKCACSAQSLQDLGYGFIKEGLPRPKPPPPCEEFTSLYTSQTLTVGDLTTEDYTKLTPDEGSFYLSVCDERVQDFCDRCAGEKKFIFALTDDWCLKQADQTLAREVCANPAASGTSDGTGYMTKTATYDSFGYKSIWRSCPQHFGSPGKEKEMSFFSVEAAPEPQTIPSELAIRIGMASQPVDPNRETDGALIWVEEDPKLLESQTESDPAKQVEEGTRPDEGFRWPVMAVGRYLYWELSVDGTGGDVTLARVEQHVMVTSRRSNV